ncbi:MAG: hypothetical protein JWQ27_82 [Ferruginibacter sp.]|nr:hypothetical protein [Ferruginibacter sp.]
MPSEYFTHKPNWRQILIHSLATACLVFAAETFFQLSNLQLINIFRQSTKENIMQNFTDSGMTAIDFVWFQGGTALTAMSSFIVIFISFVFLCRRRKWSWVNSMLAVLITFITFRNTHETGDLVRRYFWYSRDHFLSSIPDLVTTASIFLCIGLWLMLSKPIAVFIETGGWKPPRPDRILY